MTELIRRVRYWLRIDNADADLRAELELHRAERQRQFERDGLLPSEAAAMFAISCTA